MKVVTLFVIEVIHVLTIPESPPTTAHTIPPIASVSKSTTAIAT